ncbi:hypothetical protein GGS23DRAFT_494096 [Durotheca rogersii]|uniref:uncharacterized protein n=1 Tax=Durotheca rogersii TaxID=419775 RepID=UPI002220AE68|nr:uncharacterized protein GGS23DRAFT_494096 [Durotheca rogersii]KAI5864320.1 hypothetical protein GGS23DRAFT_494096 [Durotheca rogersii]
MGRIQLSPSGIATANRSKRWVLYVRYRYSVIGQFFFEGAYRRNEGNAYYTYIPFFSFSFLFFLCLLGSLSLAKSMTARLFRRIVVVYAPGEARIRGYACMYTAVSKTFTEPFFTAGPPGAPIRGICRLIRTSPSHCNFFSLVIFLAVVVNFLSLPSPAARGIGRPGGVGRQSDRSADLMKLIKSERAGEIHISCNRRHQALLWDYGEREGKGDGGRRGGRDDKQWPGTGETEK